MTNGIMKFLQLISHDNDDGITLYALNVIILI